MLPVLVLVLLLVRLVVGTDAFGTESPAGVELAALGTLTVLVELPVEAL